MTYIPKYSRASSGRKSFLDERRKAYSSGSTQEDEVEGLITAARNSGAFSDKDIKKFEKDFQGPKESLFRKMIDVISRPNYASAGVAKALVKGNENPIKEGWKGLKGEEKETYSDVLSEMGVKNKWAKGGVGLALDIALDPTTYFGGTAVKYAGKGAKGVAKATGKGFSKVMPESAAKFAEGGKLVKEGFQEAFSFYKPGVSKGLQDAGMVQLRRLSKVPENVNDRIVYHFAKNMDSDDLITAQDIYWKNRLVSTGKEKGAINLGNNQAQKEIISSIKELAKEIAEKAGIKNPEEWWFPGIDATKLSKGAKGASEGSMFGVKEVHKKRWGNLISEKRRLKDARKAFGISYSRIMRDKMNEVFLDDIIKGYGVKSLPEEIVSGLGKKRLRDAGDELGISNIRIMIADDIWRAKKGGMTFEKFLDNKVAAGFDNKMINKTQLKRMWDGGDTLTGDMSRIKAWEEAGEKIVPIHKKGPLSFFKREGESMLNVKKTKPLGYVKEKDAKWLKEVLAPEMQVIDRLAKMSGFDLFTRGFKTMVTAYFPAFHIRNMISGVVQNYSVLGAGAFNPINFKNGLGILRKAGDPEQMMKFGKHTHKLGDLKTAFTDTFQGSSRYFADLEDFAEAIAKGSFDKKLGIGRRAGNFVESWQKTTAMSEALRQGKSIKEALKLAEKAGFDYSKISKFESKFMKRMIPFYTFARKNAELQLSTLKHHPERILNQAKVANALSSVFGSKVTEKDMEGLPDWVLGSFGFKVEGDKYVSKLGLPLEEFTERLNKPFETTMSSLNPIVKYKLEAKLGYDFFRERDIIDIDKIQPATGEILWKAKKEGKLPKWLEQTINIEKSMYKGKVRYSGSPTALHTMRNLPTSRFQITLEKIFDNDMDSVNKYMAFFTGGRVYDIDQEMQKYYKERDLTRDIQDQMLKKGVGDRGEYFYIPQKEKVE